jgi:hypothetical protein
MGARGTGLGYYDWTLESNVDRDQYPSELIHSLYKPRRL